MISYLSKSTFDGILPLLLPWNHHEFHGSELHTMKLLGRGPAGPLTALSKGRKVLWDINPEKMADLPSIYQLCLLQMGFDWQIVFDGTINTQLCFLGQSSTHGPVSLAM